MPSKLIINEEHYEQVIKRVLEAKQFVWIGTADIKDMHVKYNGKVISFLAILNILIKKKVAIRLLHAKKPGRNFRKSFDEFPNLWINLERQLCPRVHFKHIIIDGKFAYTGSANLTGAGLGMKSSNLRNFEMGLITDDLEFVDSIIQQFDDVWIGRKCKNYGRKTYCPDPIA